MVKNHNRPWKGNVNALVGYERAFKRVVYKKKNSQGDHAG